VIESGFIGILVFALAEKLMKIRSRIFRNIVQKVILTALTCLKIKAVLCLMIIEKINPVATQSQLIGY